MPVVQLIQNIDKTIERYRMLSRGDTVLIAFSGGPDSVCLLDVLEKLQMKYGIRLCLAHFNHRLRGEAAEADALFAEETAKRRNMMFVGSSADVAAYAKECRLSVEAAGRKLRYEFFSRSSLSIGATRVAMGHTADDQAETVLMRLIRGAGPEGLAGIPPVRLLNERVRIRIVRPLMNAWRGQIMQYLKARKLEFRTDVSNEEPDYLRNRIRLELLPHLEKEYNPQIKQRMAAAASALAVENDFLSGEANLLAQEVLLERKPEWIVFDVKMLAQLHPALRSRMFAGLMKMARPQTPMLEAAHFADADSIMIAGGKMNLPGGLSLEVSEGAGLLSGRAASPPIQKEVFPIQLIGLHHVPGLDLVIKTSTIRKINSPSRLMKLCTDKRQYFDLEAVRPPLEVRVRRTGDKFSPLGMAGSKKLKDFFIDRKVPRFLRNYVPLLVCGGRIMWVMGYAIDRRFMLKQESTAALRVDYERAVSRALSRERKNS